jgi:hypothetical protein
MMNKIAPSSTLWPTSGIGIWVVLTTSPTNGTPKPLKPKWFWT